MKVHTKDGKNRQLREIGEFSLFPGNPQQLMTLWMSTKQNKKNVSVWVETSHHKSLFLPKIG